MKNIKLTHTGKNTKWSLKFYLKRALLTGVLIVIAIALWKVIFNG